MYEKLANFVIEKELDEVLFKVIKEGKYSVKRDVCQESKAGRCEGRTQLHLYSSHSEAVRDAIRMFEWRLERNA